MNFRETMHSRTGVVDAHTHGTLVNEPVRLALMDAILSALLQTRQSELAALVMKETSNVVSAGPFQGLQMSRTGELVEGDRTSKLLGVYEQELHLYIDHFRQKHYDAIVVTGFADGYYAVGLSRIFPSTPVFVFNPDESARQACSAAVELNNRKATVHVGRECTVQAIGEIAGRYRNLLCVLHHDRSPLDLLPDVLVSSLLATTDMIVDCNGNGGIAAALRNRVIHSHFFVEVLAAGRNPNTFPFLSQLSELDRWLTMWERKPGQARWAVCESKDARRLVNRA